MQNHLHCPHKLEMDSPITSDNEKEEIINVSENNLETTNEVNKYDQYKKSFSLENDNIENQSIHSEPLPNNEDDDDSILSENNDDEEDDDEQMPSELLEKIKTFEEEEKQKELENNEQDHSIKDSNKISSKISLQELQKQSKLATQQSLLALGGLRATSEYEKKKIQERKEIIIIQFQKLQEQSIDKLVDDFIKHKKFCQLQTTLDHFFELIQIFQKETLDQQNMINKLQKEIKDYQEEKKDDIQEYEKLMKKEEKYWKPNMEALKKKIELQIQDIFFFKWSFIMASLNSFAMSYLGLEVYFTYFHKLLFFLLNLLKWCCLNLIVLIQYTQQNFYQVISTLCTLIVIGLLFGKKIKYILYK